MARNRKDEKMNSKVIQIYFHSLIIIGKGQSCPSGYVIHPEGGDVPGTGLVDLKSKRFDYFYKNYPKQHKHRNLPWSKKRCASVCDSNQECKAFMYSEQFKDCKLVAYANPTVKRHAGIKSYVFCQRDGMHNFSLYHD